MLVEQREFYIVNIDCTLVLQAPKIGPYKQQMRESIAAMCAMPVDRVSIKATTSEHLGYVGRGEGVHAWVVCEVQPR
jgi:2-C-methyl-D-erythritol 2,4-cyclodiphosphate synthase